MVRFVPSVSVTYKDVPVFAAGRPCCNQIVGKIIVGRFQTVLEIIISMQIVNEQSNILHEP